MILEPDINNLLDMLVIIYYGDKKNGSNFLGLEKDILWNAFPNEMIQRCSGKNISMKIDFTKLEENHKKNVEYAERQKDKRADKKRVTIHSIDNSSDYKNRCVTITTADRKQINELVDKAYLNKEVRKDNVWKLKRILAVLVYLGRKYEVVDESTGCSSPPWFKKLDNVPNELTDRTIGKLTDVNHKYIDTAINILESMGVFQTKIVRGATKIKVLFPYHTGGTWIETDDYNKAATMIRDYFRS